MNTLRQDSLAGIVVFLVALPLCLGIAQASGLPPFVGLLTGIIGGLVVTALSPSRFATPPIAKRRGIPCSTLSGLSRQPQGNEHEHH